MKISFNILIGILLSITAMSQSQTPVYLSQTITNASCKGFYRYLPEDYNSTTKSYPLIIWVHGAGQVGQGNSTDLIKVLEWGLPKIISEGGFPSSFTVNGTEHTFIVISPQFMGWPSGNNVNAMINYASNNYRVDPERIYLMGISAGGGAIWDYASISKANSDRIAAMIPFCGTQSPQSPTQNLAGRIASSQLPVWAFHNTYDGTVPVATSRNWVNYINSYVPTPSPLAKLTEFPVQSNNAVIAHECWSLATLPTYKPQGINIYEWLLQYKRRIVVANAAPVARAGNDTSIVLPSAASLNGYASTDADGIISAYRWRKVSGPATPSFADSTAANTVVSSLSPGVYNFELRVTDNGGATATDNITVTVYAPFAAGTQQRVLIDIGAGTTTPSPSINSLYWNNITDARPGIRLTNAITTLNLPSGLGVNIINRLDGNYSTSSNGMGNGNTTGVVNDYPASATTDFALLHSSGSGLWRITGMTATKVYTVKFWGSRTNSSAPRTAEIKRADETTWKSYTATSNTNYNNAAVFLISGKTEMDFNFRTKSGSDFSALGVIDISFGEEEVDPTDPNIAPTANAGSDISITLPAATVTLNGSGADVDGSITNYAWAKLSGGAATVTAATSASTSVTALEQGAYQFELTVTDNGGLTAKDTVQVNVNAAGVTLLPAVNPANTINGLDYKYYEGNWSVLPNFTALTPVKTGTVNNFDISVANRSDQMGFSFTGFITVPADGVYTFFTTSDDGSKLLIDNVEVVNNDGLHASQERSGNIGLEAGKHAITGLFFEQGGGEVFTVSYQGAGVAKQPIPATSLYRVSIINVNNPPTASAGADRLHNLPPNTLQLSGSGADTDGTIASYKWRKISGPSLIFVNDALANVVLNNLVSGIYELELTVTDNIGGTGKDSMILTVNAPPVANAGADKLINLPPNNTQLNGAASYDLDGTITAFKWRRISGPTMTWSNDAIASPMANSLTYGIYSFELLVTDNRAGIAKDTMLLTVNNPPTANAGSNATITLPANTFTLNGTASTDVDGTITYAWSQIGTGANISSNSAPQTLVTFTAAGIYQFQLTVTDNHGATSTATVSITVLPVPSVTAKTLKVNIFGGSNPFNNSQWNNWNVVSSLTSAKFNYDDGAASNINAVITTYGLIADNGTTYASTATTCPPAVLRYTSANTSYRTLTFNGMTNTKTYNLEFYGSRSNSGNSSVFQIGNKYDTISTDNNINDVARFTEIVPDNNGRIVVNISRIGTWNYLSGFKVTEITSTSFARSTAPYLETESRRVQEVSRVDKLIIHPNPAADIIYLQLPGDITGQYKIVIVNMNGKTMLTKTGIKSTNEYREKIDVKGLTKGIYLLKLISADNQINTTLLKL